MLVFPNAKINLGLHVTEKRSDGFHNLETLFYPLSLCDIVELIPDIRRGIHFSTSGITIYNNNVEQNLCLKAVRILEVHLNTRFDLRMHLHKLIPHGAGLGGGSSDAAFVLQAINTLYDLKLEKSVLHSLASELGSDCAFFLENKAMLAYERGNVFEDFSLSLKDYWILLIKPAFGVNTAEAYSGIKPQRPTESLPAILKDPISSWKDRLVNDFEKTVLVKQPKLASIKEELYTLGALYASMSGSGSSMFGIFDTEPDPDMFKKDASLFVWKARLK